MKTSIQRLLAALAISIAALPAAATTYSVDYTDMWFNSAESGWGVNVIQQSDMIFATLFVYGSDNTPRWYVTGGGLQGSGGSTFSGSLYSTTGPYFGGAFNPAAVGNAVVGNMTLAFSGPNSGTMTYTVNGVSVTKSITRQPIRSNNLSGHYIGGLTANGTGCAGVTNGPILIFDSLSVNQSGNTITSTVNFNNSAGQPSVCTFSGTYSPQGRLGAVSGTWSCTFGGTPGNSGTFSLSAVDAGIYGFSSSFSGRDQFCSYSGQFGGVRDVQ